MKVQRIGMALASMAVASVLMAGTAGAQVYVTNNTTPTTSAPTTTTTTGEVLPNNETAAPQLAFTDEPKPASSGPSLAFTGADVAELSVIGAGMIAVGTLLSRKRRKAVKINS